MAAVRLGVAGPGDNNLPISSCQLRGGTGGTLAAQRSGTTSQQELTRVGKAELKQRVQLRREKILRITAMGQSVSGRASCHASRPERK